MPEQADGANDTVLFAEGYQEISTLPERSEMKTGRAGSVGWDGKPSPTVRFNADSRH
jgi:hypothetical protein